MIRLVLPVLVLFLAACGGGWERVAEVEGTVVSVDREHVHSQGEGVYRLWERAERSGGGKDLYTLVDYDCAGRRFRLVQFVERPAPEMEVAQIPALGVWHATAADTPGAERVERVCALIGSLEEGRGR